MSSYSFEKNLPSCEVSKQLVTELERYMLKVIENYASEETDGKYQFVIEDPFGSETFDSVQEFGRSTFPNDIEGLSVSYRSWNGHITKLEIRLGLVSYRTKLSIDVSGPSSKETAHGVINEIERIVSEHRTLNHIFYGWPDYVPMMLLIFTASSFVISGIQDDTESLLFYFLPMLFALGIVIIWMSLKKISPYTEFDTKRNKKIGQWRTWLLYGLCGAAVFGGFTKYLWG